MKSKSPFANKSPLLAYKSDMRGNYANPKYVKEELVGVKIGEALTKAGTDIFSGLTTKPKSESSDGSGRGNTSVTNITNNYGSKDKLGKSSSSGKGIRSGEKTSTITTGGKSYRQAYSEAGLPGETYSQYVNRAEKWHKDNPGNRPSSTTTTTSSSFREDFNIENGVTVAAAQMKGSPNKLIGDTMDPYGQINPGAVPPNQAQNDLGAQPIISADGSQPSARAIDMAAIENPYATPGTDFNPQSKMKAESIFGSPMQRQGLMNLGTPLHDKGHANDYEGHTHRKKGGSYKEGDYMDETDMETSYPKLHTQDVGEIKRDKKSQFMVSKNEDYSPTKIDTIRPLKGKEFKMGWGDAERNISTNPKYKKSK